MPSKTTARLTSTRCAGKQDFFFYLIHTDWRPDKPSLIILIFVFGWWVALSNRVPINPFTCACSLDVIFPKSIATRPTSNLRPMLLFRRQWKFVAIHLKLFCFRVANPEVPTIGRAMTLQVLALCKVQETNESGQIQSINSEVYSPFDGCNSDTVQVPVSMIPPPIAGFDIIPITPILGNEVSFNSQSTIAVGDIENWNWTINGGSNKSGSTVE